ncbi:hypothetical protein SynBIOSE41_01580 [Synechococcus sp. BIOS-E4-1]|nr:hypothetical protein SynBIOSE41_01580 [Synechococcus sp. BIOS-E4-1]
MDRVGWFPESDSASLGHAKPKLFLAKVVMTLTSRKSSKPFNQLMQWYESPKKMVTKFLLANLSYSAKKN